jgi:hypothetical protein
MKVALHLDLLRFQHLWATGCCVCSAVLCAAVCISALLVVPENRPDLNLARADGARWGYCARQAGRLAGKVCVSLIISISHYWLVPGSRTQLND